MDRVHRLGQEREGIVTRFIVHGTVEERMLQLQASKREQCEAALRTGADGDEHDESEPYARGRGGGTRTARAREEARRRLRLQDLALVFEEYPGASTSS